MGNIQTVRVGGKVTGQHRMTSISTARPVDGVGNKVLLQAETQAVRLQFGSAPTSTNGFLLATGVIYEIELGPTQSIQDLQVLEATSGAVLNVLAISTK